MIIDKYTKHTIFSLPLLFNSISARELKDNQFINMYVYDKNRPLLDCIYLVFKNISSSFLNKLSKLNNYYNTIYKSINGTIYTIVAFKQDEFDNYIINSINKAMYYTIGYENKIKIIKFWFNPRMNENIFKPRTRWDRPRSVFKIGNERISCCGKGCGNFGSTIEVERLPRSSLPTKENLF